MLLPDQTFPSYTAICMTLTDPVNESNVLTAVNVYTVLTGTDTNKLALVLHVVDALVPRLSTVSVGAVPVAEPPRTTCALPVAERPTPATRTRYLVVAEWLAGNVRPVPNGTTVNTPTVKMGEPKIIDPWPAAVHVPTHWTIFDKARELTVRKPVVRDDEPMVGVVSVLVRVATGPDSRPPMLGWPVPSSSTVRAVATRDDEPLICSHEPLAPVPPPCNVSTEPAPDSSEPVAPTVDPPPRYREVGETYSNPVAPTTELPTPEPLAYWSASVGPDVDWDVVDDAPCGPVAPVAP